MSDHHDWVMVAASYDRADAALDRAKAEMDSRLADLKEEWSSNAALQVAALEARARQRQEAQVAWLRARADGESAPAQDVAGTGGPGVGVSVPRDAPVGHDPRSPQPPTQQEMAAAVKAMDLGSYAQLRAKLGIGSASRGLLDS